jgi:hypothetical protein
MYTEGIGPYRAGVYVFMYFYMYIIAYYTYPVYVY